MRYTVAWSRAAENELARIWLYASDKNAIEEAGNRLEVLLRDNAVARGAGPAGQFRLLTVTSLTIDFLVDDDDRRVTVVAIRLAPPDED